jgi:hypothetical protein
VASQKPFAKTASEQKAKSVLLKRSRIRVASNVFQWRRPKRNQIPSDDHIFNLARVVHERANALPPILVFPIGSDFYVVDGHHRLAAYDTAKWKEGIPAVVFEGSLEEAYRAAIRLNSKDKLPMSRDDKSSAAWTLVKLDDPRDSRASIMKDTGIGKGTVDNMRRVWKTLNDGHHGALEDLMGLNWWQARRRAEGHPDLKEVDDWREEKADELVLALNRAKLAGRLTKDPDITALALAKLSSELPEQLIAQWNDETERPFDPQDKEGDIDF